LLAEILSLPIVPSDISASVSCYQSGGISMSTTIDRQSIVPRSAFRYRPVEPVMATQDTASSRRQASRAQHAAASRVFATSKKRHASWLIPVMMTVLATLVLLWLLQQAWSWAARVSDDLRYGRPRTTQIDAFVGHEHGQTPSHFLALNWHGRAEIIEFPGGDASKARVYLGPQLTGPDADLIPVTLQFVDHAGDHFPDMMVQIGTIDIWYRNEQGTFVLQ
jgi:hypothetical protein